jgi:hypothetical protein
MNITSLQHVEMAKKMRRNRPTPAKRSSPGPFRSARPVHPTRASGLAASARDKYDAEVTFVDQHVK